MYLVLELTSVVDANDELQVPGSAAQEKIEHKKLGMSSLKWLQSQDVANIEFLFESMLKDNGDAL